MRVWVTKSEMIDGRLPFVVTITLIILAAAFTADAQQPKKVPRIGYLAGIESSDRIAAFRQGLRELGYVEGKNIVIEYRSAQGKLDRLPALTTELVRLKVDVIVSGGSGSTRLAKKATNAIPIVMAGDPDPVGSGFVASLARPGGNVTGLATLRPELSGKRLELLREAVPKLSRLAVLGTSTMPGNAPGLKETELAAEAFGVKLQYLDVLAPNDIENRIPSRRQWACRGSLRADRPRHQFSAKTDCGPRGKGPASSDIPRARICGSRRAHELRHKPERLGPARRHFCGQNIERGEA
jgi:putative ABC transport system substrate-binding protein